MKCPRCGKHRIRHKEAKPSGFTFAALKVKYCIGCGWEKDVTKGEVAPEAPPAEPKPEFVQAPESPKAVGEWIRQVQDRMEKEVGIPRELMEPREPEPKRSLFRRLSDRFRGRGR